MKKRIVFATLIVVLLAGLTSLIPNRPTSAYPPTTPVPPTYVYPSWWGVYCTWPNVNSDFGLAQALWWFPPSNLSAIEDPETNNAGHFYAYNYLNGVYNHTDTYDLLVMHNQPGVQIVIENIWQPHRDMEINIQGYMHLKNINTGHYEDYQINPYIYWMDCQNIFLPMLRK